MARKRVAYNVLFYLSLGILVGWASGPVSAQTAVEKPPGTGDAKPKDPGPFAEQLAAARKQLADRGRDLESDIQAATEHLRAVEAQLQDGQTPDLIAKYDETVRRRDNQQAELEQLQNLVSAYQDANDAYFRTLGLRKELDDFRAALARKTVKFYPGDAVIFDAYLQQIRSVMNSQKEQMAGRRQRLEEIEGQLRKAEMRGRSLLQLERSVLQAYVETEAVRRNGTEARQALFQAKLDAAREVGEWAMSRPATQTQSAPSSAAMAREAENKRKLADELELEARDRLAYVRQQIADIQKQIEEAAGNPETTAKLENSLQYWKESEEYERRRLRQANFKKQEAQLKQELIDLDSRIQYANAAVENTRATLGNFSKEERHKLAAQHRANAEEAVKEAAQLDRDAQRTMNWMRSVQETLPIIDAGQKALEMQLRTNLQLSDYQRIFSHYARMKRIYDTERQQIDQMVTTQTVIYYQNLRLATLKRQLADAYLRTAEVLMPSQPSFFERNRKVFRALGIFLAMIAAGYLVKGLVRVTEFTATRLKNLWPSTTFSIKRITTLASFAASISQLFIWIFGIITVLYEFGIDPATSSGAIGLVGLIMAGMFQQIVVDFIKGLDIVAGRHYNVGDFVEVDSRYGHVIDFNVKYTRIRTLSGQELNIPNSRCIPSRRFPEGYVDNYVDIVLKSGADVNEAKAALLPVCLYLNRRLEPLKERPVFIDRFRAVGGRAILRYRVRVLPGCEWVVTDYFIPAVKVAMGTRGIGLDGEPKYFFINRIEIFRKLFSRQLSEQEILQEAAEVEAPSVEPDEKPPLPPEGRASSEKPPVPSDPVVATEKAPSPGEHAHREELGPFSARP